MVEKQINELVSALNNDNYVEALLCLYELYYYADIDPACNSVKIKAFFNARAISTKNPKLKALIFLAVQTTDFSIESYPFFSTFTVLSKFLNNLGFENAEQLQSTINEIINNNSAESLTEQFNRQLLTYEGHLDISIEIRTAVSDEFQQFLLNLKNWLLTIKFKEAQARSQIQLNAEQSHYLNKSLPHYLADQASNIECHYESGLIISDTGCDVEFFKEGDKLFIKVVKSMVASKKKVSSDLSSSQYDQTPGTIETIYDLSDRIGQVVKISASSSLFHAFANLDDVDFSAKTIDKARVEDEFYHAKKRVEKVANDTKYNQSLREVGLKICAKVEKAQAHKYSNLRGLTEVLNNTEKYIKEPSRENIDKLRKMAKNLQGNASKTKHRVGVGLTIIASALIIGGLLVSPFSLGISLSVAAAGGLLLWGGVTLIDNNDRDYSLPKALNKLAAVEVQQRPATKRASSDASQATQENLERLRQRGESLRQAITADNAQLTALAQCKSTDEHKEKNEHKEQRRSCFAWLVS